MPLPSSLDVGKFPFPKKVSRCLAGRAHLPTACSQRHTYRATSAIKVRGTKYPSRRAWVRIAHRRCPRGVTTPRNYRFNWPSRASWATGDKVLVCHSRTRR